MRRRQLAGVRSVAAAGLVILALSATGVVAGASSGMPGPREELPAGVPADWWQAAQENIAASEYHIRPQASGSPAGLPPPASVARDYQAPNRAQNFRTDFTSGGIRVVPRIAHSGETPAWEWGLALAGWGRDGTSPKRAAEPLAEPPRLEVKGNRAEYHRDAIVEWYVNDSRGLEQGFTISRSPRGSGASDSSGASGAEAQSGLLRLDLAVSGNVTPELSDEGQAIDFLSPGGARAIRLDHLEVADARGRDLPAWFECSGRPAEGHPNRTLESPAEKCPAGSDESGGSRWFSIVVDDTGAEYPITIDPLATSPAWTAESDQGDAGLGVSVETAGDVNGDGYSDVIIGAYLYDGGQVDEGKAFVYLGSPNGLGLAPSWTAECNQAGARFATSVATAGSVNGDGYSDVIVGARYFDQGETDEGAAFVWYGSGSSNGLGANGDPTNADWFAEGNQVDGQFGYTVACAGDVNDDGFSEVVIGARDYDRGEVDEGAVFVWYGGTGGLGSNGKPSNVDWTADGGQAGAELGFAAATAGDVNGDGFSDVIVGARYFDNGQVDEGRVIVYHGSANGLNAGPEPPWIVESDQTGALFGYSVATAGDVNGDGCSDVIIGAFSGSNVQIHEGRASVYFGRTSGLQSTPAWTAESDQADAHLGMDVGPAGDVNGDGYADVIVGAYEYDGIGRPNQGRAFVWFGGSDGLGDDGTPDNADWIGQANQNEARYGFSVSTAGDVNGDGFSDVIVGAIDYDSGQTNEGQAFVYHGSAAGPANSGLTWNVEYARRIRSAGDVNGDGFGDIIVGTADYPEVQVFYGTPSGPSTEPDWYHHASGWDEVATAGDVNGDGYSDIVVGGSFRARVWFGGADGLGENNADADWTSRRIDADGLGLVVVNTAGDVNGDGYSDLIVGGRLSDTTYVYHGSGAPEGPSTSPASAILLACSSREAVSSAGDVNGDGFSDVIVGCLGDAFVYHGSSNGLGPNPHYVWHAEQGPGVSTAGDVNGDGVSDVVVVDDGGAFVYLGHAEIGLSPTADWTDSESGFSGQSAASLGDVNGDGFSDLARGDFYRDSPGNPDAGAVFVYFGSQSGLSVTPDWAGEGDHANQGFGFKIDGADVNGDGFGDLCVVSHEGGGQNPVVSVHYGNGGPARRTGPRQFRTNGETDIVSLCRSDSETEFRIRARVLTVYGRTRLSMESEVKPLGSLFDGSDTGSTGFFGTGNTGGFTFNRLVSGLNPGTPYHWRVRPTYDLAKTPFQPHGPWIHIPTNGWNEADLRTAGTAPPTSVPNDGPIGVASAEGGPSLKLLAAGANPGRGRCEVRLSVGHRAPVDAEVLDVLGRTIATLHAGKIHDAGEHVLTWSGRDESGSAAPAGVYFIRVRSGGATAQRKVTLIR